MIQNIEMAITFFNKEKDDWYVVNLLSEKGKYLIFEATDMNGLGIKIKGSDFYKMIDKFFEEKLRN